MSPIKPALAALTFLTLAAPAWAGQTPGALTPGVLIANAAPVVKIIMIGLILACPALVAALAVGLMAPARLARCLIFTSAMSKAGPLLGGLAAAYGIANSFIGVANTNTTNIAVVAPGYAEAMLALSLGLLTGALAVIADSLLRARSPKAIA